MLLKRIGLDFYMLVRRALQLPKEQSLTLLHRGLSSFDNRLLSCSSTVRAHPFVKRGRFEAVIQGLSEHARCRRRRRLRRGDAAAKVAQ